MIACKSVSEILAPTFLEIEKEYFGPAVAWADEILDGAWSKACMKMEAEINRALENRSSYFVIMRFASDEYKKTLLDLIAQYKKYKNTNELAVFFDGISSPCLSLKPTL